MCVTNGISIELTSLKQQLLTPFQGHPVSDTFSSTLSSHVIRAIAGPFFSYQSISKSGEANVRAYIIEPVIRELTQHLSKLPSPPPECSYNSAYINMEQSIRLHGGVGRTATVDFMVIVRSKVLNIVPGEAKVNM